MKHKNSNTIIIGVVLAVIVLAVLVVIDRSTGYAILTDNAVMVSQTVPTTLTAGMPVTVSIVMKNTGTTTWTAKNNYKLGSQNPQDNNLWGTPRVLLTPTDSIKPGQSKTFTFTITPPTTAGTYNFRWQMVKEKVAWFGTKTTNVQIQVNARPVIPSQITRNIPIGSPIASPNFPEAAYTFDMDNTPGALAVLLDTSIQFAGSTQNIEEIFQFGQSGAPTVESALTSQQYAYDSGIALHVPRDSMKYYYTFTDIPILVSKAKPTDPLKIQFLGQTLTVTGVTSPTTFTALSGGEYYLVVGDSVQSNGKLVTLQNVGSAGAVVVSVDGIQETIEAHGTETVNGISITNSETFYVDNLVDRSAVLIIGELTSPTINDGDAYFAQSPSDPNWVWNVGGLTTSGVTTRSNSQEYVGPYFGIENDFAINDPNDPSPIRNGKCIDLPNHYISLCMQDVPAATTTRFSIEDEDNTDLSDARPEFTSVGTIHIDSTTTNSITVTPKNLVGTSATASILTNEVWIYPENSTSVGVYYSNSDHNVAFAGYLTSSQQTKSRFGFVSSPNTNPATEGIYLDFMKSGISANITVVPYHKTYLPHYNDNITSSWTMNHDSASQASRVYLGKFETISEPTEIWAQGPQPFPIAYVPIANIDTSMRTRYGIVIDKPSVNSAFSRLQIIIPDKLTLAQVTLKGRATVLSAP